MIELRWAGKDAEYASDGMYYKKHRALQYRYEVSRTSIYTAGSNEKEKVEICWSEWQDVPEKKE